jgi:hypothetical protein
MLLFGASELCGRFQYKPRNSPGLHANTRGGEILSKN